MLAVEEREDAWQARYSRGQIRQLLREYQRLVMHARLPRREEIIATRAGHPAEGPLDGQARLKADIDMALRGVPMHHAFIAFQVFTLCEMRCARERSKRGDAFNWRRCVGEEWGLTPGEVSEIAEEVVERVYDWLNRKPAKGYVG